MKLTLKTFMFILPAAVLLSCSAAEPDHGADNGSEVPADEEESEIIGATIICAEVDPLDKILPDCKEFAEADSPALAAKGETVSFQFVLRSSYPLTDVRIEAGDLSDGTANIAPATTAFVGYVGVDPDSYSSVPSKDKIVSATGYYPDPLIEDGSRDVSPSTNQPVWISYDIPDDAAAGSYSAGIRITGKKNGQNFLIKRTVSAEIYPVCVPEQTLLIYHWINGHLNFLNNNETPAGQRYWDLLSLVVRKARDYGQNVFMVQPINDCIITKDGSGYSNPSTKFTFDFSEFDKRVEIMLNEGHAKRIVGQHIAYRLGDWYDAFGVQVPYSPSVSIAFDETARNFLDQFFPALYGHLKEKGWDGIYWQHVADEPGTQESAESYNEIASYLKQIVPEMKILEANHSTKEVCGNIDAIAPLLDRLDYDWSFYKSQKDAGKELWFYTCMEPVGNYANRFLEQPLIQTRILHWINYRYHLDGYLHWGLDSWRTLDWEHGTIDWGGTPAGDSWIIWPAYNKVLSSIRYEAMRDGINDYELLRLLEKKDPEKAEELAAGVVMDFDSYDSRIQAFRERRKMLLDALCE